jgi:GntR family transcriptional regulator
MADDLEYTPPKYARIVAELRRRIREGVYKPGEMLPSESQLVREFGFGRTTVVRALQMLQQDGWIDREHGLGSYVKKPPVQAATAARPGLAVLDYSETSEHFQLVHAGQEPAPPPMAELLQIGPGDAAVCRQWLMSREGEPSEFVTAWIPGPLAAGTDLAKPVGLPSGIRSHLSAIKHVRFDHLVERVSARLPTREEATFLGIKRSAPVLHVVATIYDPTDRPLLVADVVLRGDLHELEDAHSIS